MLLTKSEDFQLTANNYATNDFELEHVRLR